MKDKHEDVGSFLKSPEGVALLKELRVASPVQGTAKAEGPHWLDGPQDSLGGRTAREGYAANPEYAAKAEGLTPAEQDVLAERQRQVSSERWGPEHDDEHIDGELAIAAACYATAGDGPHGRSPNDWPWDESWWKPADDRRNLVKAGALILADIERIDRAILAQQAKGEKK